MAFWAATDEVSGIAMGIGQEEMRVQTWGRPSVRNKTLPERDEDKPREVEARAFVSPGLLCSLVVIGPKR